MNIDRQRFGFGFVLTLISALGAPSYAGEAATAGAARPHEQRDLPILQLHGAGEVWVRGLQYKARFDPAGTRYIPDFGARAESSSSLDLRVAEVRVAGTCLEFERSAPPVVEDSSVSFERGAFVERYDCLREGVEQIFEFASLPARGALDVRVEFATPLAARRNEPAIDFVGVFGRVAYGRAFAVDAGGRRCDVESRLDGDAIVLHVPASFVESAQLPLWIDPLVSTFPIATTAVETSEPDVAYDAASDRWLVTYEEAFSASDHDVWAELRDASGAFLSGAYVDMTSAYWAHPRVAQNALAPSFLVVAAEGLPSGGARIVRGSIGSTASASFGAPFTISGAESGDQFNPDVGGDPASTGPTYFCVVWERSVDAANHDVFARLVDGNGALLGAGTTLLDASTGTLDTVPAVSKSAGAPPTATQQWSVVWLRTEGFPNFGDVWGAQIHRDGTITHAPFAISATEEDLYQPEVSSLLDGTSGPREYLVVYASYDSYFATGFNVVGAVVRGASVLGGADLHSQVDASTIALDQQRPAVDSDGQHFLVTYAQRSLVGASNDDLLHIDVLVSANTPRVCQAGAVAASANREWNGRLAAAHSGGGSGVRYCAVWESTDVSGGGNADVYAALLDSSVGGCATPQCFGDGSGTACPCGNTGAPGHGCANSIQAAGGLLSSAGNPSVSADTWVLLGSSMPNSSCLYFQGTTVVGGGGGSVFGDGLRCAGGSVIRLATKANVGGASQYPAGGDPPISVRGAIPAGGGTRWYQVWYRNAAAFCSVSTFNLTNGMRAIWVP